MTPVLLFFERAMSRLFIGFKIFAGRHDESQAVTKLKKKYLWSWAIAGVTMPLLILLVAQFIRPTERNPFQEQSPAQNRFAVVAVVLWPAKL